MISIFSYVAFRKVGVSYLIPCSVYRRCGLFIRHSVSIGSGATIGSGAISNIAQILRRRIQLRIGSRIEAGTNVAAVDNSWATILLQFLLQFDGALVFGAAARHINFDHLRDGRRRRWMIRRWQIQTLQRMIQRVHIIL